MTPPTCGVKGLAYTSKQDILEAFINLYIRFNHSHYRGKALFIFIG